VVEKYEKHRFNIISKFRQGGLTTVTLLLGMWKCMFQTDQQIMLLSKTDREATDIGMMVDRAVSNLPVWLSPKKDGKWNDHLKMFTETGSSVKFYSPQAARGKSVTFLIIDEVAFIEDMESIGRLCGQSCRLAEAAPWSVRSTASAIGTTRLTSKPGRSATFSTS
jgi:hypothetical protein